MIIFLVFLRKSSRHSWEQNARCEQEDRARFIAGYLMGQAKAYTTCSTWEVVVTRYAIDPANFNNFIDEMQRLPVNFDFGDHLICSNRVSDWQEPAKN